MDFEEVGERRERAHTGTAPMVAREDSSVQEGIVEEALPNGMFRIRTDRGTTLVSTVSAPMRRISVKVLPGDRVCVEVSAFDPSRGRIVRRLK